MVLNQEEYEEIKERILRLSPEDVEYLLRKIMPEIAEVIKRNIKYRKYSLSHLSSHQ